MQLRRAEVAFSRDFDGLGAVGVWRSKGVFGVWRGKGAFGVWCGNGAFGIWRGKGVPGQATARPLRGRRFAPTALRCSVLQPAAELASLTTFAALRQWRRVSLRSALSRATASPVLLGAPQARRGLSEHAFADTAVACVPNNAREESARQAVPAGGDLWSNHEPPAGTACRDAQVPAWSDASGHAWSDTPGPAGNDAAALPDDDTPRSTLSDWERAPDRRCHSRGSPNAAQRGN